MNAKNFAEPFAGMFMRLRIATATTFVSLALVGLLSVLLFQSRQEPDVVMLSATGDIHKLSRLPKDATPEEVERTARKFIELFHGWNSASVERDLSEVLNLCSDTLKLKLRDELASSQYIDTVRARQARNDVVDLKVSEASQSSRTVTLKVTGKVRIFAIDQFVGEPQSEREFGYLVTLERVPRMAPDRLNGLQVVGFQQG